MDVVVLTVTAQKKKPLLLRWVQWVRAVSWRNPTSFLTWILESAECMDDKWSNHVEFRPCRLPHAAGARKYLPPCFADNEPQAKFWFTDWACKTAHPDIFLSYWTCSYFTLLYGPDPAGSPFFLLWLMKEEISGTSGTDVVTDHLVKFRMGNVI